MSHTLAVLELAWSAAFFIAFLRASVTSFFSTSHNEDVWAVDVPVEIVSAFDDAERQFSWDWFHVGRVHPLILRVFFFWKLL